MSKIYTVLVVDPQIERLEKLAQALDPYYQVVSKTDAGDALDYAKERRAMGMPADLVVIAEDACLEEEGRHWDGIDIFAHLKAKDPKLGGLVVSDCLEPKSGLRVGTAQGLDYLTYQQFFDIASQVVDSMQKHLETVYEQKMAIGIVGVGRIGAEVMKQCSHLLPLKKVDKYYLHTRTPELANKCHRNLEPDFRDITKIVSLEEVLWRSRIVVVALSQDTTTDLDRLAELSGNLPHYRILGDAAKGTPPIYVHVSNPAELMYEFQDRSGIGAERSVFASPGGKRFQAEMSDLARTGPMTTGALRFENVHVYGPHGDGVPVFSDLYVNGKPFTEGEDAFWAKSTEKLGKKIDREYVRNAVIHYPQHDKATYGAVVEMPARATVDIIQSILADEFAVAGITCDIGAELGSASLETVCCRLLKFHNFTAQAVDIVGLNDWEKTILLEACSRQASRYEEAMKQCNI